MVITLYKLNLSPPARSVMMLMDKLGISDVKFVDVDFFSKQQFSPDYLKLNPQHTVPTLVDDDFVIWESHAICIYLISKYAENDSLYPTDPKRRAVIDQRLHFNSGVLFPPLRENSKAIILDKATEIRADIKRNIQESYEFMEKFLANSPWLAGDELTVADICCVATISSTNVAVKIDKDKYPNLAGWLQRCSELDFYKKCNEPGLADLKAFLDKHFK